MLTRMAPEPDAVARYGALPDHVADVYTGTSTDRPLLMLIHGGYWRPDYDRTHLRIFASGLADAGWQVASIEYRRIPGDPDAMIDDVRSAIALLPRQISHHNGSLLLIGHSAGGHLALWSASAGASGARDIAGVIALAPVCDVAQADLLELDGGAVRDFLGCAADERPDLDPMLLQPRVPITLVHGDQDSLVPVEFSRRYLAAKAGLPVTLTLIPGVGHFELIDPLSAAWPVVLSLITSSDNAY